MLWNTTKNYLASSEYSSKFFIIRGMDWWKILYLLTSTKTQIYAFIHAHFSLAEQSLDARCKKMDQCPTLLGVLLWVISLFSQGVCSPEGELWRTWTWAVKQDKSASGKHLHSQFIPENRVSCKEDVLLSKSLKQRIGCMESVPSASWLFYSKNTSCWAGLVLKSSRYTSSAMI